MQTTVDAGWVPIWERPQPPMAEQIRSAALRVADQDGLAAVTVERVAMEIATTNRQLRPYVLDQDDLHDLLLDHAYGEVAPVDLAGGWRDTLAALADALWTVLRRRPWLAELICMRPLAAPGALHLYETGMAALVSAGLDLATSMNTVAAVHGLAVQTGLAAAIEARVQRRYVHLAPAELHAAVVPYLRAATTGDSHPTYGRWLRECPAHHDIAEAFTFSLGLLLDGIDRTVLGPAVTRLRPVSG